MAGLALTGSAAVISTPTAYLNGNSPVTTSFSTGIYTLDLQQFDPSYGTLTGIALHFASASTYTVTLYADSDVVLQGSPANGMTIGVRMTVLGPNFGVPSVQLYSPLTGSTVADQFIPNGGNIVVNNGVSPVTNSQTVNVNAASFGTYTGVGTVSMAVSGDSFIGNILSIGGSHHEIATGTVVGSVYADYTYTAAVPEPGTMVLLGVGLIGAAMIGRKRRKAR
jgi:hypothetical protein